VDLLAPHRVPLTWLTEHGGEAIRLRTARDLAPTPQLGLEQLEQAVQESKAAVAITKKQRDDGVWGENLLGLTPLVKEGIKDVGTVAQYRRLLQLGYPRASRPFKLADRLLFRLLSRDEDPGLFFEYQKLVKVAPQAGEWVRDYEREAATCALAEAGYREDPRIRGSAHRVATPVSQFLRSPLADHPFSRSGKTLILNPEAHPPTWYSLAMVAAMPNLQRERAGFMERLGQYLSKPASKRTYTIAVGRRHIKPTHILLGDPMEADAKGNVKDIPLALHFLELLSRIGAAGESPIALRVLHRLTQDCDNHGVWRPKKLTAAPRPHHPASYHTYPLHPDPRTGESRYADVTFRLALIAKTMGRQLEYT